VEAAGVSESHASYIYQQFHSLDCLQGIKETTLELPLKQGEPYVRDAATMNRVSIRVQFVPFPWQTLK